MKRFIKHFCWVLCLVFLLSFFGGSASSNPTSVKGRSLFTPEEEAFIAIIGEERFHRESRSCEAYSRLMEYFSESLGMAECSYPEYYGGAYINDDGGLCLNIVRDCEWPEERIRSIIVDSDYRINYVDYSLSYLCKIQKDLSDYVFESDENALDDVYAFGIDERTQRVRVYLQKLSEEATNLILEQFAFPDIIDFVLSPGEVVNDTNLCAGNPISTACIAYRAEVMTSSGTTVCGVLTAGHVVALGGYLYTQNGAPFAQCILRQESGNADAAFCKITNPSYVPVNTIYDSGTQTLSLLVTSPPLNSLVYRIGISNQGLSMGYVTDTSYTTIANGFTFYGLTAATYTSTGGDSGGLIYQLSDTGIRKTAGIHKGHTGTVSIFTKATVVDSIFGTSRY